MLFTYRRGLSDCYFLIIVDITLCTTLIYQMVQIFCNPIVGEDNGIDWATSGNQEQHSINGRGIFLCIELLSKSITDVEEEMN